MLFIDACSVPDPNSVTTSLDDAGSDFATIVLIVTIGAATTHGTAVSIGRKVSVATGGIGILDGARITGGVPWPTEVVIPAKVLIVESVTVVLLIGIETEPLPVGAPELFKIKVWML